MVNVKLASSQLAVKENVALAKPGSTLQIKKQNKKICMPVPVKLTNY